MDNWISELTLLGRIAIRNLFASRLKTLILGGIILSGAILIVVGGSLLDSILVSMANSIQGSVAGHIQVYSEKSKDELALWGGMGGGDQDLGSIDNFATIRDAIQQVENVKSVVPMGVSGALIQSGNTIDLTLATLRNLVRSRLEGDTRPELQAEIDSMEAHVRQMVEVLKDDRKNFVAMMDEAAIDKEADEYLATASTDEFWSGFKADPYTALEFLENHIAPLAIDADLLFIRYVGTDTTVFSQSFPNMEIVDGVAIPTGKRGFLISKFFYEERLKLKTARRLDKIKTAMEERRTISTDAELQRFVKENTLQVKEIVLQLDPIKTTKATKALQAKLASSSEKLPELLATFFEMDDRNFQDRYTFFYDEIAPLLQLYRIGMGDVLTIKAFTKTGFVQSVNVKVYGTFRFKGLEKSALAGSLNLMDLVSFRELYGYLTSEKAEEIEELKAQTQLKEVSRDNAEAELFGGSAAETVVADATAGVISENEQLDGAARTLRTQDLMERVYKQEELEDGVVLNAAVILEDSSPAAIDRAIKAIEQVSKDKGLSLKVVSWQQAAGLLGQFVNMLRLVLFVTVFIIFVVALVVMNNSMMMATLERVREIGTLRAIGAQKRFVWQMLLIETLVIGAIFGGIGLVVGSLIVGLIHKVGIPATTDIMYFFFSGPALHPSLGVGNLVGAFIIVTVVSALACFYPAFLATRVSPLRAMQTED